MALCPRNEQTCLAATWSWGMGLRHAHYVISHFTAPSFGFEELLAAAVTRLQEWLAGWLVGCAGPREHLTSRPASQLLQVTFSETVSNSMKHQMPKWIWNMATVSTQDVSNTFHRNVANHNLCDTPKTCNMKYIWITAIQCLHGIIHLLPNVVVEWFSLPLCIREVPGSNLSPETG
jgi:hypothetical protein